MTGVRDQPLVLEESTLRVWHPLPVTSSGQVPLCCPLCRSTFSTRTWTATVRSTQRHLGADHNLVTTIEHRCSLCEDLTGMHPYRHACLRGRDRPSTTTPDTGRHLCPQCPERFTTKRGLTNHINAHNARDRRNATQPRLPAPATRQGRAPMNRTALRPAPAVPPPSHPPPPQLLGFPTSDEEEDVIPSSIPPQDEDVPAPPASPASEDEFSTPTAAPGGMFAASIPHVSTPLSSNVLGSTEPPYDMPRRNVIMSSPLSSQTSHSPRRISPPPPTLDTSLNSSQNSSNNSFNGLQPPLHNSPGHQPPSSPIISLHPSPPTPIRPHTPPSLLPSPPTLPNSPFYLPSHLLDIDLQEISPPSIGPQPAPQNFSGPQPPPRHSSGPQPAPQNISGPQPPPRHFSSPQPAPQNFSSPQPPPRHPSGPQPPPRRSSGPQLTPQRPSGPRSSRSQPPPQDPSGPQPPPHNPSGLQPPPQNSSSRSPLHHNSTPQNASGPQPPPQPPLRCLPPSENSSSYPLQGFKDKFAALLTLPRSDVTWEMFITLFDELTTFSQAHLKIQTTAIRPLSAPQARPQLSPTALQKLYKRNRRRAVRAILNPPSEICPAPVEEITSHFEEAWRPRTWDRSVLTNLPRATDPVNLAPFSPQECRYRLYKFENTSPGVDKIDYRGWKILDPDCQVISLIFSLCLKFHKIPPSWKQSTTILIPKCPNAGALTDWRPISLSLTIYKLYTALLCDRLASWCTVHNIISPYQKGFMPFDGVFEHNYILESRIRAARTQEGELCIAWLDLANAFGSVPHDALVETLNALGVGDQMVGVAGDLLSDLTSAVACSVGQTDSIPVLCGIRQGCPLSGLFFNIYVNSAFSSLPPSEQHQALAFADDLAVIGDPSNLQNLLNLISVHLGKLGFSINPRKCKTLHVSGHRPVGVRDTSFSVLGVQIPVLSEGESYTYLGNPIGFKALPPGATLEQITDSALKIMRSSLAPWQRLDALRSFIFPMLNFPMRNGKILKKDWDQFDQVIRAEVKRTLYVPQEASNDYLYGPRFEGLMGIPIASEESDLALIDSGFKLLTSRDVALTCLAKQELQAEVTSRAPTHNTYRDAMDYLSGATSIRHVGVSSPWSRCRAASRRNNVSWSADNNTETPTIHLGDTIVSPSNRSKLLKSLRSHLQRQRGVSLRQKQNQGRVPDCLQSSPVSSHFLYTGEYLSFADWRFIHKARLNVVPLNGFRHGARDKRCRRCGYHTETLAHVLNHCLPMAAHLQNRHNAIVARIKNAAAYRSWEVMGENTSVDGSLLRPDLTLKKGRQILIIDVTVPFENRPEAFAAARDEKMRKYEPVRAALRQDGMDVTIHPIVIGSLGTWDTKNDKSLLKLVTTKFLRVMARLIVCDTIAWSRCMYMQHISGRQQRPIQWANISRTHTTTDHGGTATAPNEDAAPQDDAAASQDDAAASQDDAAASQDDAAAEPPLHPGDQEQPLDAASLS
ncbi:hypothetical protein GE061_012629 [Apolygus lucorum]|uniref:Reverse transcriptase domain-containing protein n=1 Tax=Apolygus lucorum TaxID=248454 RepID=A0A8S9XU58_APOLU|nr:hypothetical protein GE061_012629 [Apolygus lucorum]